MGRNLPQALLGKRLINSILWFLCILGLSLANYHLWPFWNFGHLGVLSHWFILPSGTHNSLDRPRDRPIMIVGLDRVADLFCAAFRVEQKSIFLRNPNPVSPIKLRLSTCRFSHFQMRGPDASAALFTLRHCSSSGRSFRSAAVLSLARLFGAGSQPNDLLAASVGLAAGPLPWRLSDVSARQRLEQTHRFAAR
jgi:hypothetical protein